MSLVSAAPPADPDTLTREGVAAFARGDLDAADRLLAAAEDATADPGLVAFNRAAVFFARGQYRDAEVHYLRALADAAVPPDRRVRALYDRGVCLLKLGGDADTLRTAVGCFEACLDLAPADPGLEADARHNLELAKLLWEKARQKAPKPPTPNDPVADPPEPPKPGGREPGADPTRPAGGQPRATPEPGGKPASKGSDPRPTDRTAAGAGRLPVLNDADALQPLSADDTRALLGRVADRLERDRQANARVLAPPARPGVRDW